MDIELTQRLQPELDRGERILWSGRPDPVRLGWTRGGLRTLFTIPWTLFAIVWTLMARGMTASADAGMMGILFPLWGLMFVVIGLVMFGLSLRRVLSAFSTIYAVSDKRVIILGAGGRVSSYGPGELGSLTRLGSGTRGSLIFRDGDTQWIRRAYGLGQSSDDRALVGIKDPRAIERLIRERLLNGQR